MFFAYRGYGRLQARTTDRGPLYGIWDIDEFTMTRQTPSALLTARIVDSLQLPSGGEKWQRLIFEGSRSAVIVFRNQKGAEVFDRVGLKLDAQKGTILFTDDRDGAWKCDLNFQRLEPARLSIQGSVNGSPVSITLHRQDDSRFLLRDRGVHWIIEQNNFN
jgi:hypothetical protein